MKYTELSVVNYNPEELESGLLKPFSKKTFFGKLLRLPWLSKCLDLLYTLLAFVIALAGVLLVVGGNNGLQSPILALVGLTFLSHSLIMMFLLYLKMSTARKYHIFVCDKHDVKVRAKIIEEKASVINLSKSDKQHVRAIVTGTDDNDTVHQEVFILPCMVSGKVDVPTLDVDKGIVVFPRQTEAEQ